MTAVVAPERVDFCFPIIKSAPGADGDLVVAGICTNDRVDRDLERIDMAFSKAALQSWLDTGGNVRLQHDPMRPVGKGIKLDFRPEGHYLAAIVVDPVAVTLVKKGVLTAYSVGLTRPDFRPDPTGKAIRVITGRSDGTTEVAEVSLVDRPSNVDCSITITSKVARQVDEFIVKAAGKSGKAGRRAAREASVLVTRAAGAADASRVQAMARSAGTELSGWHLAEVTAGVRADLYSCDPAVRLTAQQILGRVA